MFCDQCGKAISIDAKFCSTCGNKISGINPVENSVKNPVNEINAEFDDLGYVIRTFTGDMITLFKECPDQSLAWARRNTRLTITDRYILITPASFSDKVSSALSLGGRLSLIAGATALVVMPAAALLVRIPVNVTAHSG